MSNKHVVPRGPQTPAAKNWVPFEWEEPKIGKQVHGEVTIARTFGAPGELDIWFLANWAYRSGSRRRWLSSHSDCYLFWRKVSCLLWFNNQLAKGLEVQWEIDAPSFKKYWCIWNGSKSTAKPPTTLQVNHISDNPGEWTDYHFEEPKEGPQGFAGTNVDKDGTLVTPYTGILGNETILLLEEEVEVVETETGAKHNFKAGDALGRTTGMHITWTLKGPFSKRQWVITKDEIAEE
ncbi:hypothetical protein CC79DRAFT_1351790 [Sarocladium strictum]